MVPSVMGTASMLFLASSIPLRIASGTSLAWRGRKRACLFGPPTATSALKLKRRPPLTPFATRLMWTTFSFSSTPWASVMMRRGPPEERSAIGPFSELESALARPLGDGTHAAVVEEAVAVEHDLVDPLLETTPRGEEPHLLGGAHVRGLLELRAQLGRERRDREQRLARAVGDHLHVGVPVAAEDREPGPRLGAAHPLAHPRPAASARDRGRIGSHQRVPAAPAALPALRRMRSSAYLTPFAL